MKIDRVHVLLDLYQCDEKTLAKANLLEQKVKKLMAQSSLEPQIQTFYQFQPFGVTAIVCADGVSFTMHTWPEYQAGAMDLYCFRDRKLAMELIEKIRNIFKSAEYQMRVRRR